VLHHPTILISNSRGIRNPSTTSVAVMAEEMESWRNPDDEEAEEEDDGDQTVSS